MIYIIKYTVINLKRTKGRGRRAWHNGLAVLALLLRPRVYNKEGGRVSYSSIVLCTAVVRVQARLMIFTMCGVIYGVIVGSRIRVARNVCV